MNSSHKAEVVPFEMLPHGNADSLSVVNVFGGYTCVVRTEDWVGVKKAVYITPDSVVDVTRPEFTFLAPQAKSDGKARLKAKKLRGIVSFGCLIPAPDDAVIGEDWAERLGVEHYEPEANTGEAKKGQFFTGGDIASGPSLHVPKYDLENFRRYHSEFVAGEPVHIHEKADGCNSRYLYLDGEYHCGSRIQWKKEFTSYSHVTLESLLANGCEEEKAKRVLENLSRQGGKTNVWWELLRRTESLQKFLRDNPGVVVYGEIFGLTNVVKYSFPEGNRFAAFDIMKDGRFLDHGEARDLAKDLSWVPTLADSQPYSFDLVTELAEGNTTAQGAKEGVIREGCVVRPIKERLSDKVGGRLVLKCVSGEFLERHRK